MDTAIKNSESAKLTSAQQITGREELLKFFQLVDTADTEQFKMFSGAIDAVWHDLLRNPKDYRAFLAAGNVDETLGHMPGNGFGIIQWVSAYHERFGQLDPIWFTDAGGALDQASYDAYLSTKVVVSAWDCGVIKPKMA